jgi:hypothetical protein
MIVRAGPGLSTPNCCRFCSFNYWHSERARQPLLRRIPSLALPHSHLFHCMAARPAATYGQESRTQDELSVSYRSRLVIQMAPR